MLKHETFTPVTDTYIEADLIRVYDSAVKSANERRAELAESEYLLSFGSLEGLVYSEQTAVVYGAFLHDFQFEFEQRGDLRRALRKAVMTGARYASYGGESTSNGQRLIDFFNRKAWFEIITDRDIASAVNGGKIASVKGYDIPSDY